MEGARWDTLQGVIMESHHKELFPLMPVVNVRVIKFLSHSIYFHSFLNVVGLQLYTLQPREYKMNAHGRQV